MASNVSINDDMMMNEKDAEIVFLRERNQRLLEKYDDLLKAYNLLKNKLDNLGAPAGRKVHNEKWQEMYRKVCISISTGVKPKVAMEELGISSKTYYNYRKVYDEEKKMREAII